MSFFKATWWRPASALIVLTLAVAALSVGGRGTALAATDGSVTVTPNPLQIGAGGSGQVSVVLTPAAAGTSIWIIQVAYDPAVAQVATDSSGNPVCTFINVQSPFVGAGGCDTKAVSHGSTPDTLVILGGVVQNDNGTPKGFTTEQTLATFTFNAVGASGAHTDLTTSVTAFLGPTGVTPSPIPATPNGAIDIIAGTSQVWGDGDCNGAVAPRDGQAILNHFLGKAELSQTSPCPAIGGAITVGSDAHTWYDFDCSGAVAPRDGQAILNHFLGKTELSQTPPCPAIGDTVTVS